MELRMTPFVKAMLGLVFEVVALLSAFQLGRNLEHKNTEKCILMRMQKQAPASFNGWVLIQAWVRQDEMPKYWVPKDGP